jgi:hypothetical protein
MGRIAPNDRISKNRSLWGLGSDSTLLLPVGLRWCRKFGQEAKLSPT